MKVILENGHIFHKTKCNHCECVFKFEDEDIESSETIFGNHGEDCATAWTLTCPFCKKQFSVTDLQCSNV